LTRRCRESSCQEGYSSRDREKPTDRGTKYTTWQAEGRPNHEFEKTCNRLGIKYTTIKGKHPWINGCIERLDKTLLEEFYAVGFRKKRYESIEELQIDLDNVKGCKDECLEIPAKAHFSRTLDTNSEKWYWLIVRINQGRKGGGRKVAFYLRFC